MLKTSEENNVNFKQKLSSGICQMVKMKIAEVDRREVDRFDHWK